ncbi:nucleotidyl transferase AbiEii/AbiGii toxin family protein [Thermodesulfobacteriota bacterium]
MDIFRQHELFEIDVLDKMRSFKLLDPLVFGGGSMLRLCHQLNRYSADLDFWFAKQTDQDAYFDKFERLFKNAYEITDAQVKHFTLLFELRAGSYPKRLKIEIRREILSIDFQDKIAFSRFATKQIVLKALTLEQAMKNKVSAFMDRGEIRDGFDIEFLLRKGIDLPEMHPEFWRLFKQKINCLKDVDFKVKLGSILENDVREYYATRKFAYLEEKMNTVVN